MKAEIHTGVLKLYPCLLKLPTGVLIYIYGVLKHRDPSKLFNKYELIRVFIFSLFFKFSQVKKYKLQYIFLFNLYYYKLLIIKKI